MKTFAECREKLDLLLEEGRTASNEDSNPKRKSVCKKLLKFVDDTDSAIDGTADLDDLAHRDARRAVARMGRQFRGRDRAPQRRAARDRQTGRTRVRRGRENRRPSTA
jgi:hypothetical protein